MEVKAENYLAMQEKKKVDQTERDDVLDIYLPYSSVNKNRGDEKGEIMCDNYCAAV